MAAARRATLIDLLRSRAQERPDKLAYRFLVDGEQEEALITYGELDRQARGIAAKLLRQATPGDRVLLLYVPGLEFLPAFFGCLYAGIIAVPAYPPDPARLDRTLPRLRAIVRSAGCKIVASTSQLIALAGALCGQDPVLKSLEWVNTDAEPTAAAEAWSAPAVREESVAFLQYTSGSTGDPKGAILSHRNLITNLDQIRSSVGLTPQSDLAVWLPMYHDMGLIGSLLEVVWLGTTCTFMSPVHFLQRPMRWLMAISKYGASATAGPNFGYELCVRKVEPDLLDGIDLSHCAVACSGSERVRTETLDRFSATFARCGFRRGAFQPVYGLAEATLIVSGSKLGVIRAEVVDSRQLEVASRVAPAESPERGRCYVSCGPAVQGVKIAIVDPTTRCRRAEREVGEIWVRGDNVANGYWDQSEASASAFGGRIEPSGEGPYLRTGDLGYLDGGDLFVTGRSKDVIIIRGRTYYPEDIETLVEACHPSLRPGCCAAFSVERDAGEELVIVAEVERRRGRERRETTPASEAAVGRRDGLDRRVHAVLPCVPAAQAMDGEGLVAAIRQAVSGRLLLRPADVVLLQAGTIPKTSSGKLQRRHCRTSYLKGTLVALALPGLDHSSGSAAGLAK